MTYTKTYSSRMLKIMRDVEKVCSGFYEHHKNLIYSIVLTGSLARGDIPPNQKIFDADIVLVSRITYNPFLCTLLKRNIERSIKNVKFDLGLSYPISRLKKEKSLLMYDVKNNGRVLAGRNITTIIPEISPKDLYPFESIRLLMNASCHVAFCFSDDEKQLSREIDKAMKWCLDAFLLYKGKFAPSFQERKKIVQRKYPSFFSTFNEVVNCNDLREKYRKGRLQLLKVMKLIYQDLGLKNVIELISLLEKNYTYPISFRAYSLLISRRFRSIFRNPIFDIYRFAISYIKNFKTPASLFMNSIEPFNEIWEKLPQPVVR